MSSLSHLLLSLESVVPGLSAADTLTARGNDPWCHTAVVVNALRTATPFASWEVVTPIIPAPAAAGAAPAPVAAPVAVAALVAVVPPFVRTRARWLERWANLCGKHAQDYKLVPISSRALFMDKANEVLDCAAVIGGLTTIALLLKPRPRAQILY